MQFGQDNFLKALRGLVMGDDGFMVDRPIMLTQMELGSNVALASDETNARVIHVDETNDTVGHLTFPVPRDFDEKADVMKVRVLASLLTVSTDDDVELDSEVYVKVPGSALGSDLDIDAPGTVLSATEQWIEFDLSGNEVQRDSVINFKLITNGANDTNGEEVQIHGMELSYRSALVSFDREDSDGVSLR